MIIDRKINPQKDVFVVFFGSNVAHEVAHGEKTHFLETTCRLQLRGWNNVDTKFTERIEVNPWGKKKLRLCKRCEKKIKEARDAE